MVISFSNATFRLDEDSVSLVIEAATGAFCDEDSSFSQVLQLPPFQMFLSFMEFGGAKLEM